MGKRHGRSSTAVKPKPAPVVHSAIPTVLPAPAPTVARPFITKPRGGLALVAYQFLAFLASLRLTVVLFALSLLLIFFGTIAQMDQGIFTVLHGYFRTGLAWIPWQVFVRFGQVFLGVPHSVRVPGYFPFPGGWLLGAILLVNLLAAHTVRFRISWQRSGVLILHAGLIILMLGELVTGLFAVEAKMTIALDETVSFVEVSDAPELAITDTSDAKVDRVTAIPASFLRKDAIIRQENLPFDVRVLEYMKNSAPVDVEPGNPPDEDQFTMLNGQKVRLEARAEGKGVDSEQREDSPAIRVQLLKKGTNEPVGTFLLSWWFNQNSVGRLYQFPDQTVTVDGKTYKLEFRPERVYKPYAIHLDQFTHTFYPGTEIPKDYSSRVQLTDPQHNEKREVQIYMNNPLRYGGETFYQSGFLPGDRGTILQVVRNPGWLMPYFSCFLVALGMLVHFGLHLVQFLIRRLAEL